jgi:Nucleoside phosphorylase
VLKAEDEEVIERIEKYLSDCIAVEMEGYGFAEGAYRRPDVDALVIRGISDNLADKGNDDEESAQRRAADHAVQFGVEVLREYQNRYPERGVPSSAISSYEDRFAVELQKITKLPETLLERDIEVGKDDRRSREGLVNYWNNHERLLLTGTAGRGKTVLLSNIA